MNSSSASSRRYSPLDQLIEVIDTGLRTVFSTPASQRDYPAATVAEDSLSDADSIRAARYMRINHAGEVAAQGLYSGQALTARQPDVQQNMQLAAQEENDHLNWCARRLDELGSHTSYLDPFWYAGSVTIGALAGIAGDKWSLGFVAETERQVVEHLQGHLQNLSAEDQRSRAILEQMKLDEGKHATTAVECGAAELPAPVKAMMKLTAKIMTRTAYWL